MPAGSDPHAPSEDRLGAELAVLLVRSLSIGLGAGLVVGGALLAGSPGASLTLLLLWGLLGVAVGLVVSGLRLLVS
jgi:hypothetical protein